MLTVSMPTRDTPPHLLNKAVRSVLDSTGVDLRLVVVNDGGGPVNLPKDDRLRLLTLPYNRGRYFCDAVVLAATHNGYLTFHDADDWSEPDRYWRLFPLARSEGAVIAPYWMHGVGHPTPTLMRPARDLDRRGYRHIGCWTTGIYSVQRLWKAGGINPGFRVGFDTTLVLLLAATGPIKVGKTPGYHYVRRNGSLTQDPRTSLSSLHRTQARQRLRLLYEEALCRLDRREPLFPLTYNSVAPSVWREVEEQAERLEAMW